MTNIYNYPLKYATYKIPRKTSSTSLAAEGTVRRYYKTSTETIAQNIQQSYCSGNLIWNLRTINQNYKNPKTSKAATATTNSQIDCRRPFSTFKKYTIVQCYSKLIPSSVQRISAYPPNHIEPMDPPMSSQITYFSEMEDLEALSIINANLDGENGELNLDAILDYVMGEDDDNLEDSKNPLVRLINEEILNNSNNSVDELDSRYHAQKKSRIMFPGNKFEVGNQPKSFIFYSNAPLNVDTYLCFSKPLTATPHTMESDTQYKRKTCIYQNLSKNGQTQKTIPDCFMLHPENSLSYGVPCLYFNSTLDSVQGIPNFKVLSNNQPEVFSHFAYQTPQVHYRVMLPDKWEFNHRNSHDFVELQPKSFAKAPAELQVEATIAPLSADEERLAYKNLTDISKIDIQINDNCRELFQAEHETQCLKVKHPCPFYFSQCIWYDTSFGLAKHIRWMHSEKLVQKKATDYNINFSFVEALKEYGTRIVQEYNFRLFFIFIRYYNSYIFITCQELCESVEQHIEKIKVLLILKHVNGIKTWKGDVKSINVPISNLWATNNALIIPMQYLKHPQTVHFQLYVHLGP